MLSQRKVAGYETIWALARLIILLSLFVWFFWPELSEIALAGFESGEAAHALVAPVAILLFIYCRYQSPPGNLNKGSRWGIVLLLTAFAMYAATTWPFSYGYVRNIAMVPALAGVVLVSCGWQTLKLSLPVLLIALLAIPIPSRINARLIIRPETYTIAAVTTTLNRLPGIDTVAKGVDLFFSSEHHSGIVALGESNRGARLMLAFAMMGVFVLFSQIRSIWRMITMALAAVPIVLFCNYFRLLCWALIVIYTSIMPPSTLPRNISTVCSLFVAYGLFVLVCAVRLNLFVEVEQDDIDKKKVGNENI